MVQLHLARAGAHATDLHEVAGLVALRMRRRAVGAPCEPAALAADLRNEADVLRAVLTDTLADMRVALDRLEQVSGHARACGLVRAGGAA